MLKMLIMGPAGVGKGTMSKLISAYYQIPHISSGDMFREHIKNNTPLGQEANKYIAHGNLVPDDVTIAMVKERLSQDDCKNGYLLDGFPRSLPQAIAIEELGINAVINLTIDEDLLVQRITNRRVCSKCATSFNLVTLPPIKEGICDKCGAPLIQREDDTYEKLMTRLKSYHEQTKCLVDTYYREKGIVHDINAGQTKEQEFEDIKKVLTEIFGGNK